ncbi:MAG: alpha/beta hydrolase [Ketobacter sp.]|nr:MAG: alpha/beta hydrolase [Ketobacter sp.]
MSLRTQGVINDPSLVLDQLCNHMITHNKKPLLILSLLVTLLSLYFCAYFFALLGVVAFIYLARLVAQTPHGHLDMRAALSLNLLDFGIRLKPEKSMEFRLPLRVNLLYPLSSLLPNEPVANTSDISVGGGEGDLPARVYWPRKTVEPEGDLPVIVYFHGGGFVLGSVDIFDDLCRSLANATKAVVVSVEYRLAPMFPYPAAVEDGYAAVKWVADHAAELGAAPDKVFVAGDSAGASISSVVAIKAMEAGAPRIKGQILYYPQTDMRGTQYDSIIHFSDGYGLSSEMIAGFHQAYCAQVEDLAHPSLSPMMAQDLSGLPPALVMTAGFDPLHDAGQLYAKMLQEQQVPVTFLDYKDMIHGFMSIRFFPQRRDVLHETGKFVDRLVGR